MPRAYTHPIVALILPLALGCVTACCPRALALDPAKDVTQYAHTSWKIGEGFATGTIHQIAQTPDGYLWLATESGLLRFDGVRTVLWQPPEGQHLPSDDIRGLIAARDGTLWLGTAKGLVSWKDGKLIDYPELAERDIYTLLEDREGTVWASGIVWEAGYSEPGKLCAVKNRNVQCYGGDGSFGFGVTALYVDSQANLWLGAATGLWQWRPGPPKHYALPARMCTAQTAFIFHRNALLEGEHGKLLVAGPAAIGELVDGKLRAYPAPSAEWQVKDATLLRDRNGGLWIGSLDGGLLHIHQGRTDVFAQSDGLSGNDVESLFEDREGNIWVTTTGGLDRFREYAVTTISIKQGLSSPFVVSILAARDGSVWLGTTHGLNRWKNGQVSIYRAPSSGGTGSEAMAAGVGQRQRSPEPSAAEHARVTVHEVALQDNFIESLFQDVQGRIWVSTDGGLGYFENDRFIPLGAVHVPSIPIAQDTAGNIWITDTDRGLCRLRGGKPTECIPWAELEIRSSASNPLVADPARGGLWLASWRGGVVYFKDGQVRASYGPGDGLGNGRVTALQLDPDGTLWAATDGGLSRIKNGRVATLTNKNGLPCDTVHDLVEDEAHSFWVYTTCGLVRIARSELEAWAADPKRTVKSTVFDTSDGVRNHAGVYYPAPRVAKTADGKVWFLPLNGVSVLDPRHLPFNELPPPVRIEQITANGELHDLADAGNRPLWLPPRIHDLLIDFTALSFVAPEKVHFRYKLEGQDPDWKEVVNKREVQYSNLAPGSYRFSVMASNNSGVWNETGDTLDFSIAPAYYQTNWFRGLCATSILALFWLLYRLRIQQLRRHERKLREIIETIPVNVWSANPDGSVDFVNQHTFESIGISREGLLGWQWGSAVHPDDLPRYVEKWRATLATGKAMQTEARVKQPDGTYHSWLVRSVPLRDGLGNIIKWYGSGTDIEDRKRAEEAARRSDKEFRDLIDNVPAMFFMALPGPSNAFASRSWSEYTGFRAEETSGSQWQNAIHPDDVKRHLEKWRVCSVSGEPFEDEARFRRAADGQYRWFLVRALPTGDEAGKILRWYGVLTDIEDRKQAEEALRRSEKELQDTFDTIPAIAFSTTADGSLTRSNQRWRQYTGVSADRSWGMEVDNPNWREATPLHPEDFEGFMQSWLRSLSVGEPFEYEARLRRADGEYRWFLIRAVSLRDEQGNILKRYVIDTDIEDRKRAEEALRRSEAYLALAQRLTKTGSSAWPVVGTPYWSDEMFRIHGFDPQQGVPDPELIVQRIHPEDRERMKQNIEKVLHEKTDWIHQFRIVLPDGTVKHLESVAHRVFDSAGRLSELISATVDITERKRAEEALRRSEAYLAEAQRMTKTGSSAWPVVGTLYWSDEMFRIHDFDPQQGVPDLEVLMQRIHPEDRERVKESIEEMKQNIEGVRREKTDWMHQFRIVLPDDTVKHLETVAHSVYDSAGRLSEIISTVADVTERKRADEALRRSEAYLAEAQRMSHTGSWAHPAVGTRYWSDEMFRIFGFDPQQGVPEPTNFVQRFHPEDRDRVVHEIVTAWHDGKDWVHQFRIVQPDGAVRHVEVVSHPVLDSAGKLLQRVGTAMDVTERKHAEEEREKLRQLELNLAHMNRISTLGELSASIAHEIRQPIAAVVTSADACLRWLAHNPPELVRARMAVTRVKDDGTRAAEVITRLRSFYIKDGSEQRELVDVNEVAREMLALLRSEVNRYSISIHTDLAAELPKTQADRVQLQQVFMNLVLNGIEAMKDTGGELTVKSERMDDGQLLISISDTGVGLPAEGPDRIFDAFYTTKPQGTGMGLAITRSIVEAHGGRLWATANEVRGSTFKFTLSATMQAAA